MKEKRNLIIGGGLVGLIAIGLVAAGNPGNMGFCIACFVRDIAGAMGLHNASSVQYVRPEIIGLICGSLIVSLIGKEFNPRGGSSPLLRFVLGVGVAVGALVFLGCPLRMTLRIAGGDMNAVVGLVGFIAGILVGVYFLNKGFSLGRTYRQRKADGLAISAINLLLLAAVLVVPTFFIFSTEGPGAQHAALILSLAAGLAVGAMAQRTRFCMMGGIRDVVMFKDWTLLSGFIALIVFAAIGNALLGTFHFGFQDQPIAHTDGLWNFLGMLAVGLGSVMLGGCPLRQLVMSGEGSSDSALAVLGLLVGAACCHNFGLAASPTGVPFNGKIALLIVLVIMVVILITNLERRKAND